MRLFRFWGFGVLFGAACLLFSCGKDDEGAADPGVSGPFDEWNGTSDISWYDGSGTLFQFESAAQFAGFAELVNSGTSFKGKTITLEVNVKLNRELKFDADHNVTNAGELRPWQPIGSSTHPFSGIFDGKNHVVSGLYCELDDKTSTSGPAGLFGLLRYGSDSENGETVVKNLRVTGSFVNGYRAGAVAGELDGSTYKGQWPSMVMDCTGDAVVKGTSAGGVVGYVDNNSRIEGCSHTGYVESNAGGRAGGVAGECNGRMAYCSNLGEVKGRYAGGIAGQADGTIVFSCNRGAVKVLEAASDVVCMLGGIVGRVNCHAEVSDCYSIGGFEAFVDPQIAFYVGGICSFMHEMSDDNFPTVKNCYTVVSCNNYKDDLYAQVNPIMGSTEGNNSNIKWSNCFTKNDEDLRYNSTYRNETGYVYFIDATFEDRSGILTPVEDREVINGSTTLLEALNAASDGTWKVVAGENDGYPVFVR